MGRRQDAKEAVKQAIKERDELRKQADAAIERVDEFNKTLIKEYEEANGLLNEGGS